jgi:hypothetical protein
MRVIPSPLGEGEQSKSSDFADILLFTIYDSRFTAQWLQAVFSSSQFLLGRPGTFSEW